MVVVAGRNLCVYLDCSGALRALTEQRSALNRDALAGPNQLQGVESSSAVLSSLLLYYFRG